MSPPCECIDDAFTRLLLLLQVPLDSSKWQDFLTCLTGIAGTAAAALVSHDVATNASALLAFGGVQADPGVQQRYNECYVAIDPFRAPFLKRLPPTIVDGDELVDGEAFQRGASYNELIAPVGETELI